MQRTYFSSDQLETVTRAVEMAEELVSNHYKLSSSQLRRLNYDVKTLADLSETEIVEGHFAQIVKYRLKKKAMLRESEAEDFYKICLQDHSILAALAEHPELELLSFLLYIVCHEMIHVVRFKRFLQQFDASDAEKLEEERRVHAMTREILAPLTFNGLSPVLRFYGEWSSQEDPLS
jgi:hypothetical protein